MLYYGNQQFSAAAKSLDMFLLPSRSQNVHCLKTAKREDFANRALLAILDLVQGSDGGVRCPWGRGRRGTATL
jgi:hypothetical protein